MATWNDFTFALPKQIQKEHWAQEKNKKECKQETGKRRERNGQKSPWKRSNHYSWKILPRKFIILSSVREENIHILECTRHKKKMEWKETKLNEALRNKSLDLQRNERKGSDNKAI